MPPTIILSTNSSWNIVNFRGGLIKALREQGYHVIALAPHDAYSPQLAAMGVEHVPIAIDSQGVSPIGDLALFVEYYRRLGEIRPAAFLGFTAKPNVWGSLAAHRLGIPVINNISGLGTAFIEKGPLRRIVSALYRIALRRSAVIFFQNPEDRLLFLERKLARPEQARLLPGSGIDLTRFQPAREPSPEPDGFTFLLAGRLLWQKGVGEYVEAARQVRREAPQARFQLLGFLDAANRSAVDRKSVEAWAAEGLIDYVGAADDVRPWFEAADCIVLPSYREGLPRVLLEGAAMAKPLIATDVPGCRQVVEHERTGLLCAVGDAAALAEAMLKMMRLAPDVRKAMGAAGRATVEQTFAENGAIRPYLETIAQAIDSRT